MTQSIFGVGQYIISRHRSEHCVHFIVSGEVKSCAYSENGKQVQYETLRAGMMLGELSAIDRSLPSYDCIAVKETTIASMSAATFNKMLDEYPSIRSLVMRRLVSMVRRQMLRVFEFSTTNVPNRVKLELLRIADETSDGSRDIVIEQPPTHSDIAARISTHREAVTRELSRLQASGAITWQRDMHVIHNKDQLQSLLKSSTA